MGEAHKRILDMVEEEGPYDGVMGFSEVRTTSCPLCGIYFIDK